MSYHSLNLKHTTQLKPMAAELERVESALHATRKALAADEFELQKVAAQQKVADQQAATLKVSTEVSWKGL